MLVVFFVVAFSAIAMTLLISWRLEGVAAAINDAGSLRMRSYRMGHLLAQGLQASPAELASLAAEAGDEAARFERALADLESGDPVRPLAPPRDTQTHAQLLAVKEAWITRIGPLLRQYLESPERSGRSIAAAGYDREVVGFVAGINELVLRMERNYASDTNLLRTLQIVLVVLSVLGTGVLIRFFTALVIRPVEQLHDGMTRMTGREFSVRLPVESNNEFGVLAAGFNHMAAQLQELYANLEERVAIETRNLAERNRELGVLYETTAFLNEPDKLEDLCRGFLRRIKESSGARAGAVRLYCSGSDELFLLAHEGLSEEFVEAEVALRCGQCLCGEAMADGVSMAVDIGRPPPGMTLRTCAREGFSTASAFTISHKKQVLGVYNLYFAEPRQFGEREVHLLETLGQHLGVAVENLRLWSREKELAISEERNLLAQELHDSIAQGLAFLNIQAQLLQDSLRRENVDEALETAARMREGIQESYDDVRELLVHFRTRVHHADLDTAIRAALERFERQTAVVTAFERIGRSFPLAPEEELQVLHIVQESLSNIRKHARAAEVTVKIERGPGRLRVEIADDGVGFDPLDAAASASDNHVGLKIMKERASRIGGECSVSSAPGKGTRVTLELVRQRKEIAPDD